MKKNDDIIEAIILRCSDCENLFDLNTLSKNEWSMQTNYLKIRCPFCGGIFKILMNANG